MKNVMVNIDTDNNEFIVADSLKKTAAIFTLMEFDKLYGKVTDTTVELTMKKGTIEYTMMGRWDSTTDTMPTEVWRDGNLLGMLGTFNFHPTDGMGNLDMGKFKQEIEILNN